MLLSLKEGRPSPLSSVASSPQILYKNMDRPLALAVGSAGHAQAMAEANAKEAYTDADLQIGAILNVRVPKAPSPPPGLPGDLRPRADPS